jgi:hypothetical protein
VAQAVEGKPPHMAFKAWRRTIPSSNMPLNSITERELDELPATIKASLNNMAGFYSKVMSPGPLPEWAADSHPQPAAVPGDLDEHIGEVCSSAGPLLPCDVLDIPISDGEVFKAVKGLKRSTAPGPDDIPSLFLKKSPAIVRTTLARIFNASWRYGVLPQVWKHANSFCLFKKGSRSDPSSYRIISITSILVRTFERVVKVRLTEFLERRGFFSPFQAGFRHSLSTVDHLYLLQRAIRNAMRKGRQLPVVFLDIVKAFDRVPHDRLLYKVYTQGGISGQVNFPPEGLL